MNFLQWLFGKKQATSTILNFDGKGRFATEVTDCDRYQPVLEKLCGTEAIPGKGLGVEATLKQEDYDPANTHPLRVEVQGTMIGHLSPRDAKRILQQLRQGGGTKTVGQCRAMIYFHPDANARSPRYTMRLDLPQ
ncbi:MAG: hypothetical protein NTV55_05760 [Planctomycetota bacterium]|nr:hypothetical protein [Planctomycetota bacterium]RLS41427.1 MAG: hypothetical protein DWH82_00345 [Planctomycetota bacterium]